MHLHGGAVVRCAGQRELELARQVGELGMDRGPLAQDFRIGARIHDLVCGRTGEVIGGDVADAVARGLQRMHLDGGEFVEDLRNVLQRRPVELQVLAGCEMAVALVEAARDVGELAHLARRQHAVGNGDAQHVGVQLQVDAIHQAMDAELVFRQLAIQAAVHLVAELGDPVGHEASIEFVIAIHGVPLRGLAGGRLLAVIKMNGRTHGADPVANMCGLRAGGGQGDVEGKDVDDLVLRDRHLGVLQGRFHHRLCVEDGSLGQEFDPVTARAKIDNDSIRQAIGSHDLWHCGLIPGV